MKRLFTVINSSIVVTTFRHLMIMALITWAGVAHAATLSISNVSIPNSTMKIGDTVLATITTSDDGGTTFSLISGTIGGFTLGSLTRINNTTYTASFSVTAGGSDFPAASSIPVANLVLNDGVASNPPYSQNITQANDLLDSNYPTVVSINRQTPATSPTNATSLIFRTTFSESVTGVTFGLFSLTKTATTSAPSAISGSGSGPYDVTVPGVSGNGNVRLDLAATGAITDAAGNPLNTAFNTGQVYLIDNQLPVITAVSIPNAAMKIGDVVTATITVNTDADVYTLGTSTIDGFTLGGISKSNNTTYTATFTVGNTGADVAAGSNIPISVIVIDPAGNSSATFTTAIAQAGDPIDATAPNITAVSIPNASMKIGDVVNVTITVTSDGDTYTLNAGTINGYTLGGFSKTNNTTYAATFTVTSPGTDRAAAANIPVSLIVNDGAGNVSNTFTTAISQGSDPLDATAPVITAVSIPNTGMKIGDVVTATITVSSDADTYTLVGGSTIGGYTLGSLNKTNSTTYTATFTVTAGSDVAAATDIPVNVTLKDTAGNNSNNFTTVISQGGDPIDATAPSITAVSIPNTAMKIGDVVTATITVASDVDTYTLAASNIDGFALGSLNKISNTSYTATFTITNSGADVAAGANIPLSVKLTDTAGNNSNTFTTAIAQASDPIDATAPSFTAVLPTPSTGFRKIGDQVVINLTATGSEATFVAGTTMTVNGVDVKPTFTNLTGGAYKVTYTVSALDTDRASGTLPISLDFTDASGNSSTITSFTAANTLVIDANVPVITNVTIPNTPMKVGDVVTATITVNSDPGTFTLGTSTIDGFTLGGISRTNSTTYTATFTVTNGGTDITAAANIPLSVIVIDPAGNPSAAYTTAIAQANDAIDANRPVITAVSIPNVSMKVGSVVTATITVNSDADAYTLQSSTIGGFSLTGLLKSNNTTYTATFTVTNGGADVAAGSNIPVSVVLQDTGGNNNSPAFTTAIVQASDPIDANNPAAFTVGTLTTTGGNIVTTFWNLTNTGLDVVVPIANDASLAPTGTVQLQAKVSTDVTWTSIGAASTIAAVNTNKTVSVTAAQLEGIPNFGESVTVQVRAIITDVAGNSTTGAQSANTLFVDQVAPSFTTTPKIYYDAVGSDGVPASNTREAVLFGVNEPVTLLSKSVSGTIQVTAGSTTVTGTSTKFLTEFVVGQEIWNSAGTAVVGKIASIGSNTSITLALGSNITLAASSNYSKRYTPTAAPVGTISSATNSTAITGVGTNFLTDLTAGAQLWTTGGTFIGYISSVTSNTAAVLANNGANAVSGQNYVVGYRVLDFDNNSSVGFRVNDGVGGNDVGLTSKGVFYFNSYSTAFTSPVTYTRAIRLISGGGNGTSNWSDSATPPTQVSYTPTGNLFDVAGNEYSMATTTVTAGNTNPPVVTPNTMTLFPRATNPEKIVFTLNASLSQPGTQDGAGTITSTTASPAVVGVGTTFTADFNVGLPIFDVTGLHLLGLVQTITDDTHLTLTANAGYAVTGGGYTIGAVSGTIDANTASTTVTGTNTLFQTELAVGQELWDITGTQKIGVIASIASNISLTLSANSLSTVTGVPYTTSVVGFTVAPAPASPFVAFYSGKGTTNTITLMSAANGDFAAGSTVSYTQAAGNAVGVNSVELADITNHVLVVETVAPSITSVSIPNSTMKVGDVVTATITTADDDGDNPILVSGALDNFALGSLTSVNGTTKTATFTVTEGGTDVAAGSNITFSTNLVLKDGQNNTGTAYSTAIAQANDNIDANSPKVLSINRQSATTAWSTSTFGTSASSVVFRVTFSENINLATISAADFAVSSTGSVAGAVIGTPVVVTANTVFDITVNGYTGTGLLGLNYVDNNDANAIQDVNGNSTITSLVNPDGDFTGQTYSIVLPQPTENVNNTSIVTVTTPNSIKVTWTEPTPLPTHYLLVAKTTSGGGFPAPFDVINGNEDGTLVADDVVLADGTAAKNIPAGTNTFTFTGLNSGTSYDFILYVYNLSANNASDNVDYLTAADATPPTAIPAFTVLTSTAASGAITAGTTAAPANINSITASAAVTQVFTFKLQDDGLSLTDDNSRTMFNKLVIKSNAGTTVSDWNKVIASAKLTDITAVPGSISGTTSTATLITANTIEFTSLSTAVNGIGSLNDDQLKEYKLEIQLKTAINGTLAGSTPETIDNTRFEFLVDASSFTLDPNSSNFDGTQTQNSDPGNLNTNNKIDVTASALTFTTQPISPALVFTNITSTSAAPDNSTTPVVRARDANNNTDADYNNQVNITNAASIAMSNLQPGNKLTAASGIITFPTNFQFNDKGNGTLTVAGPGAPAVTSAVSSALTINYDINNKITAGALTEPATISSLSNVTPVSVFDFVVTDDNGAGGDGSPTRITGIKITQLTGNDIADWTQAIATASLTDGTSSIAGTVNATDITFTGLPTTLSTDEGFIADNGNKTYTLNITLKAAMGGTLPATVDNLNLAFEILETNVTLSALSSDFTAVGTQSANSGATNNAITVVADRLIFTTQPPATAFVLTNLTTTPVVTARDGNGNTDLNYVTALNIANAGSITMTSNTVTPVAGVATFPGGFQYNDKGNGTLTVSVTGLTPATSTAVAVSYDNNNRITAGALTEPATISSLSNGPGLVSVFDFNIVDDNGAGGDGSPTRFTSLKITQQTGNDIADWTQAIGSATLTVGASTLTGTINATDITFAGLASTLGTDPGFIGDNGTKTYTLNITIKSVLGGTLPTTIDNLNLAFEMLESNVSLTALSSDFTAVGTQSTASGATNNAVTVVATKLDFTSIPASGSINVPFAPVVVEARDVNANRDLDFVSAVSAFSNTSSLTMLNTPFTPSPILSFNTPSPGVLTFPANFQFTSSPASGSTQMTISAGGILNQNSPPFTIISSQESVLSYVPAGFPTRLNYLYSQASNIIVDANSVPIATFQLNDGNGVTNDTDGASTTISSVQLEISTTDILGNTVLGSKDIKQIALYDGSGLELGEQTLGAATTVTFNIAPANYITAPDNGLTTFTVRVSFNSGAANIKDRDNIRIKVLNVTQGPGSEFNPVTSVTSGSWTKATGAVASATQTPNTVNIVDVIATKIDFVTQPGPFAGINEPTTTATLRANDQAGLQDLEFSNPIVLTTPPGGATPSGGPFSFTQGFADLSGMQYSSVGKGTLTVTAGGINSNQTGSVLGFSNVSVTCNNVEVLNTNIALATIGVTGSTNLAGGSVDQVIFGVTFSAQGGYTAGTEPKLNSFRVGFGNPSSYPLNTIFTNIRVFENTGSASFGGPNITTFGGTVTFDPNNTDLVVTLGAGRTLTSSRSYFFEVDVVSTANGSTPSVVPQVLDNGYPTITNGNIVTSKGSASGTVTGQGYSFSAIFPPTLSKTYPANAQTNVDVNQQFIYMTFSVPVWSLDGIVELYDGVTNTKIGDLTLNGTGPNSGQFANGTVANVGNPLKFNLPASGLLAPGFPLLQPDHLYYILVPSAKFFGNTPPPGTPNVGIMDQAGNLFGGISYSGTFYFKTANPNPPNMLAKPVAQVDPGVTNATVSGGVISAVFDQPGTAYYLVLPGGTAAPTAAEVYTGTHVSKVAAGSFPITQVNPNSQFGVISPAALLTAGANYDVWISAESYSELGSVSGAVVTKTLNKIPATNPLPYGSGGFIAKPGTITAATNSKVVTGSGTSFNLLKPGWTLFDATGTVTIGTIASISNATSLTLTGNAANPITAAPYTASGFEAGGTGPTLTFTPGAASGSLSFNNPTITICTNVFQTLNQPLIFTESSSKSDFSGAGTQTFNLVLPAGFAFDTNTSGTVSINTGADWIGTPILGYVGNSILTVTYTNSGNASLDQISITGLKVSSSSPGGGSISRFGGNAFLAQVPDLTPIASISAANASGITFYNDYSLSAFGNKIVNTIPDLIPGTNATSVQLIPDPPFGDFGVSTFSGTGVNANTLSTKTPTLNAPFNITINHTDNNGCPSSGFIQYTVYDHTTAISDLSTQYCATNSNFQIWTPNGTENVGLATHLHTINFNKLQSYYLDGLTADVPASGQIMSGTAWKNIINTTFITKLFNGPNGALGPGGGYNPANNPIPGHEYFDYRIDEAVILNANSGGAVGINPYDNFIKKSSQGNTYYDGGSLGKVRFTATYQSIANKLITIPLQQDVEFFVPAVPIIETNPPSYLDKLDPLNPPGPAPTTGVPGSSNQGTPVFCQLGGTIFINALPAASPGTSTGTIVLEDGTQPHGSAAIIASGTVIIGTTTIFKDNQNGTATLDPTALSLQNGFKDIRIVYTYSETGKPCSSTATQMIRISPNPIAGFTYQSTPNSYVATSSGACAGQPITFTSAATSSDPINSTFKSYDWNFGDPSSPLNTGTGAGLNHTFAAPSTTAPYTVTHSVVSFYGCPSVTAALPTSIQPFTKTIDVGGIPVVKFKMDGISTATPFRFNSNSTPVAFPASGAFTTNLAANSTTVSTNDNIASYTWSFGDIAATTITRSTPTVPDDNSFNNDVVSFNYSTADIGPHLVDLKVTSRLGCVNSLSLQNSFRSVVVLPSGSSTPALPYLADFESNSANWQPWLASTPTVTATVNPSWKYKPASRSVIKPGALNGFGFWATFGSIVSPTTGQTVYNGSERSALYSAMMDISQLSTPMISFDNIVQLETSDGLVLEYSQDNLNIADPNKTWIVLGKIGAGVGWYNSRGIAGKPGNQNGNDFGWSGSTDTQWQTSKQKLDTLSITGALNKVVFRFALGSSNPTPSFEGFALDNVRIGERTRTILLESFANTGNSAPAEASENSKIAAFPGTSTGTQVIKINYHVNFPANDPLNMDNPADPSARSLYYGITSSPKSRLDGSKDPADRPFSAWSNTSYGVRSLQLAQAALTPTVTNTGGMISVRVKVDAKFDLPANTILQVAIVERNIPKSSLSASQQSLVASGESNFTDVLKVMLPSAAGTRFTTPLPQGGIRNFPLPTPTTANPSYDWAPDKSRLYAPASTNDLRVIAFLQNEDTGEIYQVNYVDVDDPTGVITGLEPIPADDIVVYPNPANNQFTVRFPGTLANPAALQLIDQVGTVSLRSKAAEGSNAVTIQTSDLASGLYILQIEIAPGVITHKKVMVVHQE